MNNFFGETTIYGTVVGVGLGSGRPVIQFRLIDEVSLECSADRACAITAAQRIGQEIGLSGIAEWDGETFDLKAFQAEYVSEYEQTSLIKAFQAISDKYGDAFNAIKDVPSFCKEVRRGD